MDFIVKYFKEDKVACRYLTSTFVRHTWVEDDKKRFEEGTQDLEMIQISMDGPKVNFKLYESITEERNEIEDYPALIDVGQCSLHAVHGAFWNGVQKKCGIDSVLKSLHNMFDDVPAKIE